MRMMLLSALLFATLWRSTNSQGCTNTCPPLNYGIPVPSLCEGDDAGSFANLDRRYTPCGDADADSFSFRDLQSSGRIIVLANFYVGCNAGRRESGVYAHVAQRYYEAFPNDVTFLTSLKGGATCQQWADIYQRDAVDLYPTSSIVPKEMPIAIHDEEYEIRDDFFTTPFGHPSYVILDADLRVRHKFIGPCCGYESFFDCTADIARELDGTLSSYLDALLAARGVSPSSVVDTEPIAPPPFLPPPTWITTGNPDTTTSVPICGAFSEWSACSTTCGPGIQFRYRSNCPSLPVETRPCMSPIPCEDVATCNPPVEEVASGFAGARDVSFHPTPGYHLGSYSEGRTFQPTQGEEAWVLNAHNHSVSIVASLGTPFQTTISRTDRGYYHYMINATALAFNMVANSGRTPDRDSFQYWAVCNDNLNTYLDTKEPNYFMGPTLYNSDPSNRNLVNRLGAPCSPQEECYFLHADMLHESPGCIGIAHDPETTTTHGNVYWAFDTTGNGMNGELVRFDFQQPHGPGSMDHSVASVRRYPGVRLTRGPPGVHAGMIVHATRREVFVADPGANRVLAVDADSGSYARTARAEYPIFSNRLPSFEYSIFGCETQREFAVGIQTPSGVALSNDGRRLYVAERATGDILVYEVSTGSLLQRVATGFRTLGGLAVSPRTGILHFVDESSNALYKVDLDWNCASTATSRENPAFQQLLATATASVPELSLYRDYTCTPDPIVADSAYFDQVHDDTGYASDNPDVQSMAGMDETAALLANRTDCGYFSELNFDQLLLGGFFCHPCLPHDNGALCDAGGICRNEQWLGYMCDNELYVTSDSNGIVLARPDGSVVDPDSVSLRQGVTYRFTVEGNTEVCLVTPGSWDMASCATNGPVFAVIDRDMPAGLAVRTTDHSILLKVDKVSWTAPTWINTTEDLASEQESNMPWVISCVVGSVVVLVLLAVVAFWLFRRKQEPFRKTDNTFVKEEQSVENQNHGRQSYH